MTFDQIYDSTYYRSFSATNSAIDELVEDKTLETDKVEAKDADGHVFMIRRFYLPSARTPIQSR
jgi:hypothetical protein